MNYIDQFHTVVRALTAYDDSGGSLSGISLIDQFRPGEKDPGLQAISLNAALLVLLAGPGHPEHERAESFVRSLAQDPAWSKSAEFILSAPELIKSELSGKADEDPGFTRRIGELYSAVTGAGDFPVILKGLREVFFPEGRFTDNELENEIYRLRSRRKVTVTGPNPDPVREPHKQVIITSNVLLTVPGRDTGPLPERISEKLSHIRKEKQLFWYDHPVQVGTSPEANEVIYGLSGLDRALDFEKQKGTMPMDETMTCILSVSVTHSGLHEVAREYIESELKEHCSLRNLSVYVFTEDDTRDILDRVILPCAREYLPGTGVQDLHEIFGVDGEYGRHYSFLKAIAAFWKTFITPESRATFKIDLDQVFPQQVLEEETGRTFFQHLMTPLWGARGLDSSGRKVHLGMIAGSLVNESDIGSSLFTPDVRFPEGATEYDGLIFCSALPQALSTEAEMMTRYSAGGPIDGEKTCIQRIHVTGGTNGILIDSLFRYRPFTPGFIGRAEDQAYLLSVLFKNDENGLLRYVHESGLIMRHDKTAFAGEAIEAARVGKMTGDYIRTLLFSFYSRSLPWDFGEIKESIDPFTGCFVSAIPFTVVLLRFALKTASMCASPDERQTGIDFFRLGIERIGSVIGMLSENREILRDRYYREKEAWDTFYDVLEIISGREADCDEFVRDIHAQARVIADRCRLSF